MNFLKPPLNSAGDIERAIHKIQYYPLSQQSELAHAILKALEQLQTIGEIKSEQASALRSQVSRWVMTKPAPKGTQTWESKPKSSWDTPTTPPSEPAGSRTDDLPVSTELVNSADNSSTVLTPETSIPPSTSAPAPDPPSSMTLVRAGRRKSDGKS